MANQKTIVDVRSRGEYMSGHVQGSINIPVQEISDRLEEIKTLKQPLVLCCASGARSGMAMSMLLREGVDCFNGGSWMDVQYELTKNQ